MSVAAGVVTFNPQVGRLRENLGAVAGQVGEVMVFDNASGNIAEVRRAALDTAASTTGTPVTVFESPANIGMAAALDALCEVAIAKGYTHVLLLDQDSVIQWGLVEAEVRCLSDGVGLVCPCVIDRNEMDGLEDMDAPCADVDRAITSGSLVSLEAFRDVSGYDRLLFVDWVDLDFCANLRLHGHRVVRARDAVLLHELGRKERAGVTLGKGGRFGVRLRPYYRTNHPHSRRFDMARSMAIVLMKYAGSPVFGRVLRWATVSLVRSLVHERRKPDLIRATAAGAVAGVRAERYRRAEGDLRRRV